MSVNDFLEKWRDGTYRYVERYKAGTKINGKSMGGKYKTVENKHNSKTKFYQGEKVGIWNNEPQQKIVPEINHKDYVKGDYYRASISLNVPLNGTQHKPNYKNFTYVVVDFKDNIDMMEMYETLIEEMESKSGLGYKRSNFDGWFPYSYKDCDKQFPKPYSTRSSSRTFEGSGF